jgi:hypothetical protein
MKVSVVEDIKPKGLKFNSIGDLPSNKLFRVIDNTARQDYIGSYIYKSNSNLNTAIYFGNMGVHVIFTIGDWWTFEEAAPGTEIHITV